MLFSSLLCIFIPIFLFTASLSDPLPPLLLTRLVPPHSLYSHFSNPNTTISEIAAIDLKTSISRASSLVINASNLFDLNDLESQLIPRLKTGFLAALEVGMNFVDQLVYMDTGSSLLWINCEPCGLYRPEPIFRPLESSSYEKENCQETLVCSASGGVRIECYNNEDRDCRYKIRYGGSDFSEGHLARETFKFGGSTETFRMVFGCAKSSNLYVNGVLGLGAGRLSLMAQRSYSKFSYCLGNFSDRSYNFSTLVIGDQGMLKGYQTPMVVEDKYYITLEEITIDNHPLKIDRDIFRRTSSYTGGMAVDTGSTYTFIPQTELSKFEEEIDNFIDGNLKRIFSISYNGKYTRLCYDGHLSDLEDFPTVRFHFQGDAVMELSIDNLFQQVDDRSFCLTILPSEVVSIPFSILGSRIQQFFYVAFDINEKNLSFERMDCETIDRYIHDEY